MRPVRFAHSDLPDVRLVDPIKPIDADAVVVGVASSPNGPQLVNGAEPVDAALDYGIEPALAAIRATGATGDVISVPTLGIAPFPLVMAAGLGPDPDEPEAVRRGIGAALRTLTERERVHIAISGPLAPIVEGALLGGYTFDGFKSTPRAARLRTITIAATDGDARGGALDHARSVAAAVNTARDFVNCPPNDLTPDAFAARAARLAADRGLETEILDDRDLQRDGYGGLLAVGAGSAHPPRLLRIGYRPAQPAARAALIGKGITFDSGGLNLKTADMHLMKFDMAGAAAVVAATLAAAELGLPVEVIATVPMAENVPSGGSYRPSDVLRLRSGRMVEVSNTDAEGRLVLVDAISRAVEDSPDYLLEASTLTGAQKLAFGTQTIAVMGQPELRDQVVDAGRAAGESLWPMPLPDDLRPRLDSAVADLMNAPTERGGAMLIAGLFLAEFVPAGLPWTHLDIAGPAWNSDSPHGYTPTGATGAAVRTLIASLETLADSA